MARHRNVRGYNYDEDFEDDDLYGQSVEDDYCISPSTAAQFIYSRRDQSSELGDDDDVYEDLKESSKSFSNHQLSGVDQARLHSCLDYMREVLGDAVPDEILIEAILKNKFDTQKALAVVLEQDKVHNLKVKSEEAVAIGKPEKGVLFSSSEVSANNVQSYCPLSANGLDCSSTLFDFSDPVSKCELYHNSPVVPNYSLVHKIKKLYRPTSEKRLDSCKLTQELSLAELINDMPNDSFYESCKSQPSVTLSTDRMESLLSKSPNADLIRSHASECISEDDTEFKGIPDLKSLVIKNAPLFVESKSLSDFHNIPVQNSPLENRTLDNLNAHKKTKFGNAPLVDQSAKNSIFKEDSLQFSDYESPSLAELCQEHKGNPKQCFMLSDLCNASSASFTELSLGSFPLSQLADRHQSSTGISELTGSLSSLAFSKASPTRDHDNLSLSDLIAETIDVDKSQIKKDPCKFSLPEIRSSGIDSNIDLSVLIKTPAFVPKPLVDQSVASTSETKVQSSKLGKSSNFAKDNKKNNKGSLNRKPPFSFSWTKALAARPSAFASTLCLHYPSKSCKRRTFHLYKTFLYGRQVQDVKDKDKSPLIAITPFDFKSASPDDIVKANQKKAFTRE
ncbi:uncharacterized protein ACDL77_013027 [Rhynchocyon petersi]